MAAAVLAAGLLLAACSSGSAKPTVAGSSAPGSAPASGSAAIPGLEKVAKDPSHVHATGPLTYDQAPPVGGKHNPRWLRCGVYDQMPPLELATHSLEHGTVWLAYRPGTSAADVAALVAIRESTRSSREWGLVTPYDNLRAPVVAVTWGVSLAVDSASDPRLVTFMNTYAGGPQGGERGVPCASADGALTVTEGRQLIASQS